MHLLHPLDHLGLKRRQPCAGRWQVTPTSRDAFVHLLDRDTPWRFLPICGPSETGKSHITRQMLANALQITGLACGRFDFKGTTSIDAELRAFVQDLDVPVPQTSRGLHECLGEILDLLRQRARPALLIFDTYEAAGETQAWVEKQLLPSLIRATWLRVVIAGQRVPQRAGTVWEAVARDPLRLAVPSPSDWFEYGRKYRDHLTLALVESLCSLANNRTSVIAQLLGPNT